uniref:Immunoglobulin V-set domain-containing protein n=1 Tax=Amphilophus citrinellus TaxID=61819 RepID=A0A3Q0RSE9_AMPCI
MFLTPSTVSPAALTAVTQTQQTVLAAVGEDAEFSSQLLENKDVLQVTWQKISGDGGENVATYNKDFGQRVNDGFIDKFQFKYTGLQNCSIFIRNMMEQDEACYHCLTCLQVYVKKLVRASNKHRLFPVQPGPPAATVTLSVSQQDLSFSQYNTVSVSNTNNHCHYSCAMWFKCLTQGHNAAQGQELEPTTFRLQGERLPTALLPHYFSHFLLCVVVAGVICASEQVLFILVQLINVCAALTVLKPFSVTHRELQMNDMRN